jgi:hypothetical protein
MCDKLPGLADGISEMDFTGLHKLETICRRTRMRDKTFMIILKATLKNERCTGFEMCKAALQRDYKILAKLPWLLHLGRHLDRVQSFD